MKQILHSSKDINTFSANHGKKWNLLQNKKCENQILTRIDACSSYVDNELKFLRASLGGLVSTGHTVTVNCPPFSCDINPEEAIEFPGNTKN